MSENDAEKSVSEIESDAANSKEFALADFKLNPISSSETIETPVAAANAEADLPKNAAETLPANAHSERMKNPIFKRLSEPFLPAPRRENRARLQMQSPTRLHFYWSFKTNPFETAQTVFGAAASNYVLVVKISNQTKGDYEMFPVDADGSWWFDADAGSTYRAEIGFYSARRPFVRLMFSNAVSTPRQNPSARAATAADWSVTANDFADVLDASGFSQDAFEVALAGDDAAFAETAVKTAFAQMFGETDNDVFNDDSSEMRFALLALAAGYSPDDLRGQISRSLYLRLQANAAELNAEKALVALRENFGVFGIDENEEIESLAPAVFGASLINFPRLSKRRFAPRFAAFSSFSSFR